MKGQRFSLLPMPFMMGFTLALAHVSLMVPNCIKIHADVRLAGDFPSQQTSNCAQEHMDQSRLIMLRCQWLNFLQSSFWSKGLLDPSAFTPTQALSRRQGAVEISWCKVHITSDNFHQFDLTPEILVDNAVEERSKRFSCCQ